jgi:hypothetical protein
LLLKRWPAKFTDAYEEIVVSVSRLEEDPNVEFSYSDCICTPNDTLNNHLHRTKIEPLYKVMTDDFLLFQPVSLEKQNHQYTLVTSGSGQRAK